MPFSTREMRRRYLSSNPGYKLSLSTITVRRGLCLQSSLTEILFSEEDEIKPFGIILDPYLTFNTHNQSFSPRPADSTFCVALVCPQPRTPRDYVQSIRPHLARAFSPRLDGLFRGVTRPTSQSSAMCSARHQLTCLAP